MDGLGAWILVLLENSISCSFCQWNLVWIILCEWQYWRYYDELSKSQFFSNFTNHQKDKLIALSMSSHHNSFRCFLFSSVSTSIFVTTLKHRCFVFLMLLCFIIIIIISIIIYVHYRPRLNCCRNKYGHHCISATTKRAFQISLRKSSFFLERMCCKGSQDKWNYEILMPYRIEKLHTHLQI